MEIDGATVLLLVVVTVTIVGLVMAALVAAGFFGSHESSADRALTRASSKSTSGHQGATVAGAEGEGAGGATGATGPAGAGVFVREARGGVVLWDHHGHSGFVADGASGERGWRGLRGETGERGEPGPRGAEGAAGVAGGASNTGATGPAGADGAAGRHGHDGNDGKDGKDGKDGRDGRDGWDGPAGAQGEPGPPSLVTGATGMEGFSVDVTGVAGGVLVISEFNTAFLAAGTTGPTGAAPCHVVAFALGPVPRGGVTVGPDEEGGLAIAFGTHNGLGSSQSHPDIGQTAMDTLAFPAPCHGRARSLQVRVVAAWGEALPINTGSGRPPASVAALRVGVWLARAGATTFEESPLFVQQAHLPDGAPSQFRLHNEVDGVPVAPGDQLVLFASTVDEAHAAQAQLHRLSASFELAPT
jgi:Collagen triple helix repeat (20 copies)